MVTLLLIKRLASLQWDNQKKVVFVFSVAVVESIVELFLIFHYIPLLLTSFS